MHDYSLAEDMSLSELYGNVIMISAITRKFASQISTPTAEPPESVTLLELAAKVEEQNCTSQALLQHPAVAGIMLRVITHLGV